MQTYIQRTDSGNTGNYDTPLPMYDINGNIQKEEVTVNGVTRTRIKLNGEDENGKVTVEIAGTNYSHKFEIQLFEEYDKDLERTVFKYEYRLVGDVRAVLNKDWSDIPVSQKDQIMKAWQANVTLQVQRYNYATGRYEDFNASSGNEGYISYRYKTTEDGSYTKYNTETDKSGQFTVNRNTLVDPGDVNGLTNPKYSMEVLNLPRYDEYGHLNRFTIREVSIVPQTASSPIYSAKIDQDPMLFTAKNIFGDGGERINFHKVWMDDGEEEYKTDVGIHMTSRALPLPYQTSSVNSSSLDWESYTNETDLQNAVNGLNAGTTGWGNYYPWTESQFTDTLMSTKGIGNRYELVSDDSSPNKFKGIGAYTQAGTVDMNIRYNSNNNYSSLMFKLQKKPAGSTADQYTDVKDSSITASRYILDTDIDTYSQENGSFKINNSDFPNNWSGSNSIKIKIKDLDIYKVDGDNRYQYTYNFSIDNSGGNVWGGSSFSESHGEPVTVSDTKEYIILDITKNYSQTTVDCIFTVSRSYTDSNGTTHTENVTGLSAERYYEDKTYNPNGNGVYSIPVADRLKNNLYSLKIVGLDNSYDYRAVITNSNGNSTGTTISEVSGQYSGWVYRYNPLSPSTDPLTDAYYDGMDSTKLAHLNSVLNYAHSSGNMLNTGVAMNDDNVWTGLVEVRIGYSYGLFKGTDFGNQKYDDSMYKDQFDLRDFQEYLDTSNKKVIAREYTLRTDGNDLNSTFTDYWLKMLPAQYKDETAQNTVVQYNSDHTKNNIVDLTDAATKQNTNGLPIYFNWFAGVYKATYNKNGGYDRYYAVQEIPTYTYPTFDGDSNYYRKLSDLTFQNTRIGITNYHVQFDWKVGSREVEMENVSVRILADYHDGNDPRYVTILDGNGGTTDEIKIDLIRDAQGKLINDYYITNLPKYTTTGEIITYTLEEVKVNDTPFDSKKRCSLGFDQLYYEIKEENYKVNQTSNSDDLYTIVISNYFSGTRDFTVNKVWKDDTNALKSRTDLYIKFWKHSTNPNYHGSDTQVAQDYLWKKDATDTENHWSYTYKGLAKYDSEGYRYEYYVTEKTDKLKLNDYQTYYSNAVHMTAREVGGSHTYTSQDSIFTIPHEHITAGQQFSIKISGLDYEAPFEEPGKQNIFEYRVVNYAGEALSGVTVTLSEPSDKKVDVTITRDPTPQVPTNNVIFRLQRKLVSQTGGEEYWLDVPDFYEIDEQDGGTNYSGYNVSEEAYAQNPNKEGRAYDNGTITNKLKAPVILQGLPTSESYRDNFNEIHTHEYTYQVVLCDEHGDEITESQNSVQISSQTPSTDGNLNISVTVTKGESASDENICFKLMRKYKDALDTEYKPVSKKADKSTLWAAKTNEDNSRPLHKVVDVTNSYHPDESNYKSKLTIDKDWNTFDNENPVNKEFNGISNYSFKLKRYATNIQEKALFKVDTGTNADGVPYIDITNVYKDNDFTITQNSFTKKKNLVVTRTDSASEVKFKLKRSANSADETLDEIYTIPAGETSLTINDVDIQNGSNMDYTYNAVSSTDGTALTGFTCAYDGAEYYGTTITLTKDAYHGSTGTIAPIKIIIRVIDTSENNRPSKKVEIEGLSIYAQNGMVYTYVVDEIEMNAYHRKDDNRKERKITLVKNETTGKVESGHAEFALENELKYFNLNINKVFGAEYKDASGTTKYDKLEPEDYVLYFNDEFVKNLKFTLQRRKKTANNDGTWSVYSTLQLNQTKPVIRENVDYIEPTVVENSDGKSTITGQLSIYTDGSRKGQYYYTFKYLPIESVDGVLYEYRIIESSANVGDHVSIYYPSGNDAVPTSEKVVETDSNNLTFKVERSTDGGTYTPLKTVNGYSPDSNGVITIPNATVVNGEYNVSISGLPLSATIDGTTVNYTYRITDITGGINVSVNSTESNNTVSFTVKANTRVKYFANVEEVGPLTSITDNVPVVTGMPDTNTYSKNGSEVWRDLYVRNIFKGKEIYIEKRWNDDNNADGLRPEKLDVTLHESFEVTGGTAPSPVELTKQLKSGEKWGRTVLMPKYYYNGLTPTNNVLVSVSENLNTAKLYYNSDAAKPTLEDVGYDKEETGYIINISGTNTDVPSDFTNSTDNPLYATNHGEEDENSERSLYGMYIINKKDHVNSRLDFDKTWNDNDQTSSRPDSIYIKTIRKKKAVLMLDNDQFTLDPSVVDKDQPVLIQGLPASSGNHAYRYYFEPELPFTVTEKGDGIVDLAIDASKISASGTYLKRSIDLYESETFSSDANGLFNINKDKTLTGGTIVSRDINGLLSVRIKDVPVSNEDEMNYSYRVVGSDGKPLDNVNISHISSGDNKKDLVISKTVSTSDNNLSFKLQQFPAYDTASDRTMSPTGSFDSEKYTIPANSAQGGVITVTIDGFEASDEFEIENLSAGSWENVNVTDGAVSDNTKSIIITAEKTENGTGDFVFKIKHYETIKGKTAELYFEDDMPYTYTPDASVYTIPTGDKIGGVYSFKLKGLESGEYRLVEPEADNQGEYTEIPAAISYSPEVEGMCDAFVTVSNYDNDLIFKIQKKNGDNFEDYNGDVTVGRYTEQVVTKDNNGSPIRAEYFPAAAAPEVVKKDSYENRIGYGDEVKKLESENGNFTIPDDYAFDGKFCILIKDLPKNANATSTDTAVQFNTRTTGENTVDILVTKTGTEGFNITVNPAPAASAKYTAVRFYPADENGVIKMPSDANLDTLSEHLDYGISVAKDSESPDPSQTVDGVWSQYYYTVVECDKDGYDSQSSLTYSQTDDESSADTFIAKKVTFTIDVSQYHSDGNDARKYLNIKLVDGTTNGNIVKKDINGDALKLTMTTTYQDSSETKTVSRDYYASNKDTDIPKEGVFVIPAPEECDYVVCEIDNLPLEVPNGAGGYKIPDYYVERCKVTNATHDKTLTFTQDPTTEDSVKVKSKVSFEYEKTFSADAGNYQLVPSSLSFKLKRSYIDETGTNVTDNSFEQSYTDSSKAISKLDSGKFIYVSGVGKVWRPYSYYLEEYDSNNEQISFNSLYKNSFTKEPDQPFVLTDEYLYADLEQGIENTLRKTKHEVKKKWEDEGDDVVNSRDKYTIVLQSTTNNISWAYVDLSKVTLLSVNETSDGKKTYSKISVPEGHYYQVPYVSYQPTKRLHYCFDNLPLYDKYGNEYSYRVVETKIGSDDVKDNQVYLFLVPGTEPTDDETSYVRTIRKGTKNYYVDHDETVGQEYTAADGTVHTGTNPKGETVTFGETDITNSIVEDIVSYSNYRATKVWKDEDNLYGKRPLEIEYFLKRTKTTPEGVTTKDDSFASNLKGNQANNWTVEWTKCAAFDNKGNKFSYYIEERTVDYYTVADTKAGASDTLVYTFTNTYEPPLRYVTAYKYWEDMSNKFALRPESIQFQLWCKYDIYKNKPIYDENDSTKIIGYDEPEKQAEGYDGPAGNNNSLVKSFLTNGDTVTLNKSNADDTDSNTWKVTFKNLPTYVNTCGDGTLVGKASEVTYYIVETVDGKTTAVYECADKEDSKTSEKKTLDLYAKQGEASATANSDTGLITLPKTEYSDTQTSSGFVYNGTVYSLLKDLPEADIYGTKYEYSLKEYKADGTTEITPSDLKLTKSSFHDNSNGTTTYVVSKELPKVYFKLTRKAKLSSSPDKFSEELVVTRQSNEIDRLTATVNGITYTADSNGVFEVPRYYTGTGADAKCLTAEVLNLPANDAYNHVYTYSVVECNADGTAKTVGNDDKMSLSALSGGKITVTKPLGTEDANVYFKLYRRTAGTDNVLIKNIVYEKAVSAEKNTELYPVDKDGIITVPKSIADRDKLTDQSTTNSGATFTLSAAKYAFNDRVNVIISGLPVLTNGASYSVNSNGTIVSTAENNDKVSLLVSVPVTPSGAENVTFTLSASDGTALNGTYKVSHVCCDYIVVNVPDLPKKDSNGNEYEYSVVEYGHNKQPVTNSDAEISSVTNAVQGDESKVKMVVTKPLPRVYYKLFCDNSAVTDTIDEHTVTLRAIAKGIAYAANSEGIFEIPQYCVTDADSDNLTFQIPELPKGEPDAHTYTIKKCDALGNVIGDTVITPES